MAAWAPGTGTPKSVRCTPGGGAGAAAAGGPETGPAAGTGAGAGAGTGGATGGPTRSSEGARPSAAAGDWPRARRERRTGESEIKYMGKKLINF